MLKNNSKYASFEQPFLIKKLTKKIKSSPLLYRLAKGSFWALTGTVATRAFSLITTIIVARLLGTEDYGGYGMVQSTLGMFGLFAGFAMGSTMTKYIAELKQKDPERTGRVLSLTKMVAVVNSGVISCIVLLSASWLAASTLNRPDLSPVIVLGAVLLFVSTQNNVQLGAIAGFESFRAMARINFIQGAATPAASIPLVYFFGIQGAILALIIISALGYWLSTLVVKRECKRYGIRPSHFDLNAIREWPILWKFSLPALMAAMLVIPVTWVTNAILVNQKNGYAEMGLFNAANQWRQLVIFIPQVLASVMLPIFSETYGRADKKEFLDAFLMNLRLTWAIALPITILVIALRNPLSELFGSQFEGTAGIITVLMAASFLSIVNNVVGTALTGAGRMWTGTAFNLAWAIALIVATALLAPGYGGRGLAYAYLLAYLLHTVWQMAYVEIKLAHSSILSNYSLVIVTAATLLPVCLLDITSLAYNSLFVAAASYPLYSLGLKNLLKATG